jgi:predicted XRE-type DNA-binding protein
LDGNNHGTQTMNKIEELEKQMADIAKAIEAEKNKGREEALETVRKLIKQYSISQREVKSVLLTRKPRATKEGIVKRVSTKTPSGKPRGRPPSKN